MQIIPQELPQELELGDRSHSSKSYISQTQEIVDPLYKHSNNKPSHLRLMLLKNYLIYRRQQSMTLLLLLSPMLICVAIILWQLIIDNLSNFLVINPAIQPQISTIPVCYGNKDCITVGYFILGEEEPWIQNVMQRVAKSNDLKFGSDVKLILTARDPLAVTDYLSSHMNMTQIAVVFCTDQWNLSSYASISIPCKFDQIQPQKLVFYTIFYNYSLLYKVPYLSDMRQAYPKDAIASKLKVSLDNAILYEFSKSTNKSMDNDYLTVYTQDYPRIPNRFIEGIDVAGNYGAFYFFAPYLLLFLLTINELLQEKGKKLRQGLVVMGLSHFSYWMSWILTTLALVGTLTTIMICTGYVIGFDLFTKTPLPILFVLFFTFGFGVQLLAFFISTICPDVKNGYTIAYGFILIAVIMQMFFTQSVLTILFYRKDASEWVKFIRIILSLYPSFKYSLIYSDISQKACKHYSLDENRWVEGRGFNYSDLFYDYEGAFTLERSAKYGSPSAIENYFHLCLSCLFYMVLTWYFDHVLASNRGRSDSIFFCFTTPFKKIRNLWRLRRNRAFNSVNLNQDVQAADYADQASKDTVEEEKRRVLFNHNNSTEVLGLRILGLSKTYSKYPLGIKSADDVHALKEVFFEVEQGELLALLGHNGAGKTTLIGVLTGMYEASSGSAQIMNYDIQTSIDSIRKIMGICPQFDILWDQLTAGEHLRMYAAIKGVEDIEKEVNDRLKDVDLNHVKDAQISTFSGGMKRRVSLAISAIGNPKIIILDEPTTGMDPKARRQVWQMIKNLKSQRVVLLTTHAMEEADALADRIAVMADGHLRCIGTSLYLKNSFSDGYRLNVVCDADKKKIVINLMERVLRESKLLDSSGGSLVFSVPLSKINSLKPFFQIVENQDNSESPTYQLEDEKGDILSEQDQLDLRSYIKDWGLSHATLEEVFMKVTKKCD